MIRRAAVTVRGIVQGVGFRPYLHRLAAAHGLCGWVRNTAFGVELELEGEPTRLDAFLHTLQTAPPPLAVLEQVEVAYLPAPAGYRGFVIRESAPGAHNTLVSPDIGLCPDCLRELRDPRDRRYRYPFVNCTNCGPRYTITRTVPYDRANTSMARFALCPACRAEYAAIENRRYHAQPDCCPACGPTLQFCGADGVPLPGDPIARAQALLRRGGILAVKGLGGFHLACRADCAAPARTLRRRKHRDEKPFALMVPDLAAARALCVVSPAAQALLESARRPIVLCPKRDPAAFPALSDTHALGLLLPYTPLHVLLFDPLPGALETPAFPALVMTSANRADCPVVTDNAEALTALAGIADGFLLHDRAIVARCDDSLVAVSPRGKPVFYRRSRGWTPQPVFTHFNADGILALGAEQKASFALGRGRAAFYSPHIGDLKNAETLAHYTGQIAHFEALFGVAPRRLVCDAHPDYLSSDEARRRAARQGLPLLAVPHHWAHLAACMADNRLDGTVLGVIWDGTGLGEDGGIWGGEFLTGGYTGYARAASLRALPLAGGDAAVREIARLALALALDAGVPVVPAPDGTPPAPCGEGPVPSLSLPFAPEELALLSAMVQKRINCPLSSGMGRLFDGVYALLTGRRAVSYEGQGAVLLQTLAEQAAGCAPAQNGAPNQTPRSAAAPPAGVFPSSPGLQAPPLSLPFAPDAAGLPRADTRPLIRALAAGKAAGVPLPALALAFHRALAALAAAGCRLAAAAAPQAQNRVVLSGGVFQNTLLLDLTQTALEQAGFTVFTHCRVAPNDEGLALGQLAIAAHLPPAPPRG